MCSYVALGRSLLRLNNCLSSNFYAVDLFKKWEEVEWFVLWDVPNTGVRAGVHDIGTRTSTSSWSIGNQAAQQEVSSRPVSEASSVFTVANLMQPFYTHLLPFTDGFSIHWWPLPRSIVSKNIVKQWFPVSTTLSGFKSWKSSIKKKIPLTVCNYMK